MLGGGLLISHGIELKAFSAAREKPPDRVRHDIGTAAHACPPVTQRAKLETARDGRQIPRRNETCLGPCPIKLLGMTLEPAETTACEAKRLAIPQPDPQYPPNDQ